MSAAELIAALAAAKREKQQADKELNDAFAALDDLRARQDKAYQAVQDAHAAIDEAAA